MVFAHIKPLEYKIST